MQPRARGIRLRHKGRMYQHFSLLPRKRNHRNHHRFRSLPSLDPHHPPLADGSEAQISHPTHPSNWALVSHPLSQSLLPSVESLLLRFLSRRGRKQTITPLVTNFTDFDLPQRGNNLLHPPLLPTGPPCKPRRHLGHGRPDGLVRRRAHGRHRSLLHACHPQRGLSLGP